ncbi:MAG: hypothetical protein RIS35_804, partial [Pseudomonadota bacterium]
MTPAELFSLSGRVAFVSGASDGIGRHVAGVLARAGASVALAARRVDRAEEAAAALRAEGLRACAVALDVTRAETIAPAFDAAETTLGAPCDVLFNNAGISVVKRFLDQQEADIDRVFDTNLKGAMMVAQEAARRMVPLQRGSIINVASIAGVRAGGFMSSYGASKAGLIQIGAVMALELAGKGIRVNTLLPGNIETGMQDAFEQAGFTETLIRRTPMRRHGRLDDLDGAVLLLASDAGR